METEKYEVEQILKKRNSKNKASQKQLLFNTLSYSVFSTKCRNGIKTNIFFIVLQTEYFVKWAGYPSTDSSWIPKKNFGEDYFLVSKFETDRIDRIIGNILITSIQINQSTDTLL